MAAPEGLTKKSDITIRAKEIDFITRFNDTWEALREILGIMRPVKKSPGTQLTASKANCYIAGWKRSRRRRSSAVSGKS